MHFIRCILPNTEEKSESFEEELVLRQLLTSSTISYARFMRFGYSKRVAYQTIIDSCKLVENKLKKHCVNRSNICSKILLSIGFKLNDFKMGNDTIAFRANSFHLLTKNPLDKIEGFIWQSKWKCVLSAIRFLSK